MREHCNFRFASLASQANFLSQYILSSSSANLQMQRRSRARHTCMPIASRICYLCLLVACNVYQTTTLCRQQKLQLKSPGMFVIRMSLHCAADVTDNDLPSLNHKLVLFSVLCMVCAGLTEQTNWCYCVMDNIWDLQPDFGWFYGHAQIWGAI